MRGNLLVAGMVFTPIERLGAYAFSILTVVFYAAFAWRRSLPYGATLRARISALLALREPSVLLDSARYVALLVWMRNTPDIELAAEYLRRGVRWTPAVGIFRWVDVFVIPPDSLPLLLWAYRIALALAIAGVMGRAASAVGAVLHALLWSIGYSTVGYSVHNHVVFMILLSLALAPEPYVPITRYVRALRDKTPLASLATYAAYVRFAAVFAIVTVYVQTGVEKVLYGSPRWFNGVTLQGHSLRKGELSVVLASWPLWLMIGLGVVVVLWETFYGLVIFYPRLRGIAVLSAWSFHELVRFVMGVTPFTFMLPSVLFFLTPYEAWAWLAARIAKSTENKSRGPEVAPAVASEVAPAVPPAPSSARSPAMRTVSVALLFALCAAQWAPTVRRRGVYPFLGNAMFSSSLQAGTVVPAEASIVARTSDGAERRISIPDAVATHQTTFSEEVFEHYLSPATDHAPKLEKRHEFCVAVLRSVVQRAEPRAVEVTLFLDFFRAPDPKLEIQALDTCRLPDLSGPLGKSSTN